MYEIEEGQAMTEGQRNVSGVDLDLLRSGAPRGSRHDGETFGTSRWGLLWSDLSSHN